NYYDVTLYLNDKEIRLRGFLDTGNQLVDPYLRRPVILVSQNVIDEKTIPHNKIYVPYTTIKEQGVIECFIPSKMYVRGLGVRKNFLVGIIKESIHIDGVDCILHSKLLE